MAHFTTTIPSPASVQSTFDYVADFANVADWDPTVKSAVRIGRKPIGMGSRFRVEMDTPVSPFVFNYEIIRYEPHHLVSFRAETDMLRSLDIIEFEEQSQGCHVHYDADLRLRRGLYLFDFAAQIAFQFSGRSSARGLEHALREIK